MTRPPPLLNTVCSRPVISLSEIPNDNINKICVLEGVGERKIYGKLSKNAVFFFFFLQNSTTIKFRNFANFIVRNFVVIWEAPTLDKTGIDQTNPTFLRRPPKLVFGGGAL